MLTTLAAACAGVLLAFSDSIAMAIVAVVLFELTVRTYNGPAYHLIVSTMNPRMRGVAISSLQIGTNLIGYSVGPLIVGLVSEHLQVAQPLRFGLAAVMLIGIWAAGHFGLALRSARRATMACAD